MCISTKTIANNNRDDSMSRWYAPYATYQLLLYHTLSSQANLKELLFKTVCFISPSRIIKHYINNETLLGKLYMKLNIFDINYIGLTDIVYKYCLELNISIMLCFIDFLSVVNFLKWDMEMY